MKLSAIAKVIRSKNAGPFIFTFDILLPDSETFERVRQSGRVTPAAVANLYGVATNEVFGFNFHPFANAIKFSIRRPIPSGSIGDSDIYGAQQHAPLLEIEVP